MKELPLVSLFCSCFLSDPLNKPTYAYEGGTPFPIPLQLREFWDLWGASIPPRHERGHPRTERGGSGIFWEFSRRLGWDLERLGQIQPLQFSQIFPARPHGWVGIQEGFIPSSWNVGSIFFSSRGFIPIRVQRRWKSLGGLLQVFQGDLHWKRDHGPIPNSKSKERWRDGDIPSPQLSQIFPAQPHPWESWNFYPTPPHP